MRKRTREVAVLKAIGYSRLIVLDSVLVEAMMIAIGGGLVGVLSARFLFSFSDITLSGIPGFPAFYVPWKSVIWALLLPRRGFRQRHHPRLCAQMSRSSTGCAKWSDSMVPLKYNIRSLRARWVSSLMTVLGTGLVVWASVLAFGLADGLDHTLEVWASRSDLIVMAKRLPPRRTASLTKHRARDRNARRHRLRRRRQSALLIRAGRGGQYAASRRRRQREYDRPWRLADCR